ncbi:hypothetical protein NQ317_013229 [Molorchus minor]|uniref:Uncharacterized protein n=1 Tax=Molorchus minor TaxID=1323400 RepID=A0ABQ9JQH5_9CUCU|nr:hypothetical protein NQ317_013229 [Molorchus minor]
MYRKGDHIDYSIKNWLRHASTRSYNKEKKENSE